jgi:hypothetical protein
LYKFACTFDIGKDACGVRALIIAIAAALSFAVCMPSGFGAPNNSMTTPSETPGPTSTPQISRSESQLPEAILRPILTEAAKLANVPRAQLVVVRAQAVVWNDGSLGCPEPGMEYAQALVNGYWVVIKAAGKTYDFRAGRDGNFRLCPEGSGRPPLPSNAQ